jgi:sec-independent protein translocase protein TatC
MAIWRRTKPDYVNPDDVRMTLGEHLEELRSRLIRAIIALVVGAVICFIYSDELLGFLCAPIFAILRKEGYPTELGFFSPAEAFMISLKVAIIVGFILTAPFSIAQIWGFVAAGLYPKERKWVRRFAPTSIVLFFTGAAFLLIVAAPMLYGFLLSYQNVLPDRANLYPAWLLGGKEREPIKVQHLDTGWPEILASQPAASLPEAGQVGGRPWPRVPALMEDPVSPPEGVFWLNCKEHQLRVRYGDEVYHLGSSGLVPVTQGPRLRPDIRISDNIIFVLELSAAFGIAFQVPVVVAFLAAVGIVPVREMARLRRYVWFGMSIAAAIITPTTDVVSMMFLLLPMVVLYEIGLWVGRIIEKRRVAASTE